MSHRVFRLGELFSGPGGIAAGALAATVKDKGTTYRVAHAWATDYDEDTCATYRTNIAKGRPETVLCADIRKLDYSRLRRISAIDALAFGFPCNDFSNVGEKKGFAGTFGPLYTYGVKALKFFKPDWFLAENVGGLTSSNEGRALGQILEELDGCGYALTPHLYKFEDYEIPQARHRVIIIGIRRSLGLEFKVPVIPNARIVTAREALADISKFAPNQELTRQAPQVVERLKHIKPGENAFNAKLPSHLELNVRGAKISQIYKRLHPDRPAYTVTGSGGGGTHVYHWSEDRALTNRERARLQTFPDDFYFCGSKESVRRQIGMAVPPNGIRFIVEAVLKTFAGIEYPNINMPPDLAVAIPNERRPLGRVSRA